MTNHPFMQEIYYPAHSVSDESWGLTVTTAGYQSVPPHSLYPAGDHPPRYHFNAKKGRILNEYQLIYVTSGRGVISTASIPETPLNEGALFMLFPDEWHNYCPDMETGWNTFWIGFKGAAMDRIIAGGFFEKTSPLVQAGFNEKVVGLFQEVLRFAGEERPGCQQLLAGYVSLLLGHIAYLKRNESITNDRIHLLIDKARALMKENLMQNISPEAIAGQLNISYSWFRRFFRKYTGMAPGQYLAQLRIRHACELLEQTNLPVQIIAEQLHFESPAYFSVYFKRQTGRTPLEYRKTKT
ncbi:MAG: AraC family transcriptional regulator [Prolixibacteraceae bacterium]